MLRKCLRAIKSGEAGTVFVPARVGFASAALRWRVRMDKAGIVSVLTFACARTTFIKQ